jgi:ribosomal protein S12 methylthiotransferase
VDRPQEADYLIVNTCGFIQAAKEESLEEILELAAIKSSNGSQKRLLVTGCLAQRYVDQLLREIPEIDGMVGIDQLDKITEILDHDAAIITPPHSSYREFEAPELSRRTSAYLKIADGCDSGCSYCAIPQIRGHYRSRSLEAIRKDLARYLEAGALELNLIAQDVARYGYDIGSSPLELLRLIEDRPEEFWLRPFYVHPRNISDDLVDFLQVSRKFCNYLEIPVQHASSRVLSQMRRGYDEKYLYHLFEKLKTRLPQTVIRTTALIGFPGETDSDFRRLQVFLEEFELPRGGVFVYSREEGTAAYRHGRLPATARVRARKEAIEAVFADNAERYNRSLICSAQSMIPESFDKDEGTVKGRLFCDAPEIDFRTAVPESENTGGGFLEVKVVDVDTEGFIAEIVREEEEC